MKITAKVLLLCMLLSFSLTNAYADEGMWLLSQLKKQNVEELEELGLKIPIDKITGEYDDSISEAVIAFGGGCTGSIISDRGLILTNYHCSYGAIQEYLSPENDITTNGFWALSEKDELPISGLEITVNKKILDVSDEVLSEYPLSVKDAVLKVTKKYEQEYPGHKVSVYSYKNNTLFVMYIQVKYSDIRMVGVPPKNVAKFGGESDNWMWPRYNADFAYFRVYSDKNGNPASYSESNIPLYFKNHLRVSTEGYNKGDFAMSIGYPAQNDRNATSFQVLQKTEALNPPIISVREVTLSILEEEMNKSEESRHLYSEKFSTIANYYKDAVGMNYWVDELNVPAKKEDYQNRWMDWVMSDATRKEKYQNILPNLKLEIESNSNNMLAQSYYSECFNIASDLASFYSAFGNGFKGYPDGFKKGSEHSKNLSINTLSYYQRMNLDVEKRILKAVLVLINDSLSDEYYPDIFVEKNLTSRESIEKYVEDAFRVSVFADKNRLKEWLAKPSFSVETDPIVLLLNSINTKQREIFSNTFGEKARKIHNLASTYNNSIADFETGHYYPNADRTVRLSYGTVQDLTFDNKTKPYQTTLTGLINRSDTVNPDYFLNEQLKNIWDNKDYGKYGIDGEMPVCFITNGDVTGGNSGSPMLNAQGELIGLVLDCNWESMTRDFNYDIDLNRAICVDFRYALLITEKFSGSTRIVDEIGASNR